MFISAEHSAQQSSEDLDRYEREFNEGKINILSCSTTMEMGVDIGGITEVVMNNVPPKSSNYLQRTGRAGRRNETKALALTVCAPNPIGTHTWNNPDYPITHVTETPLLKLESRQLIQRHVNAMVFASFVADQGGIRVTATLRDFFVTAEGMSFFDKFLNYIDSVISGKVERLQEPYSKLIKGTSLAQITLADAAQVVKKDIVAVYNVFDAHKGALAKAIESLKNESGTTNAIKAIEKQEENLLKTSMLSYLAENSFLPSA
ncbi:helicase-related protein, partial [Alistipes putredinis]|uniref:helicase-related protein n=1 Tax=Alistipes putredinis TaxID=28117 RepID=UPI003FD7885A